MIERMLKSTSLSVAVDLESGNRRSSQILN